jgi:hypothetical protein
VKSLTRERLKSLNCIECQIYKTSGLVIFSDRDGTIHAHYAQVFRRNLLCRDGS